VEYKSTTKNSWGFQVKIATGVSFFGVADTAWFGDIKTMWNEGTGEAQGEATAYSASVSGTMTIKPAAGGGVGNCSFIEVRGRGKDGCTGLLCVHAPTCLAPPPPRISQCPSTPACLCSPRLKQLLPC
jgi:hypothetical protein